MTTHLELARIQLNSSGIPLGASQGVGTIIELETPYDGNANPVDVHLVYPASVAIPGQTIVSCYFQSNEGWYIVQGEPGPAGQGGSPWVRFRALNPIGYQSSGIWNCVVTQTLAVGVDVGDEITIHDPNNLFADVVFAAYQTATKCDAANYIGGSTGTAYLRTPQSSDNNPDGVTRWEVETCSRSIDRMNVRLIECMKAYDGSNEWTGTGYIKQNDAWNLSAYPAVDFPPELEDDPISESEYCWKVAITNPLALTAQADSIISVRRHTRKKPSIPLNAVTPHDVGVEQDSEEWWVEQVYERRVNPNAGGSFARYIIVTKGGDWDGYSLVRYWDGQDPSPDVDCRPLIDCTFPCDCLEDGDQLFGVYNEFTHTYELISTASAMLGSPDDIPIMNSFAGDLGCTFSFAEQTIKAFACGSTPTPGSASLETTTVGVYASGYRNQNDLCLQKIDIEVCSWDVGEVDCYNLCAECDCDDHVCAYQYTPGEGWELVKACPTEFEDCCCTGEMPTNTPAPGEATYVTFPCGPCPSECLECVICETECPDGITIVIDDIVGDLNNGDRVESQNATQIWTIGEEDCCFNLEMQFKEAFSGQTATATAKVCLIDPSTMPQCQMNGNYALSFEWTPAVVLGMTLPTEMGASQPYQCVAEYGNNLGCGILPDFPDAGGNWDNVTATVNCCEVVEGGNRNIALESMGVHDIGAGFHNASLQAPPPAPREAAKPQGWGDAFVQENPTLFKGCGCKKDIVPVMNRWARREGEPTDDQVLLVATTLYGKQKRGIQSQISVESLSDDIREFTNRMRENG